MPEGLEYHLIRTSAELEAFAPRWSVLWREDPYATPFQSPAWLLPWWHQFGQPDLRAVSILQNGSPIGWLPFYIYREPRTGERQLLLLGVGTTDYLDGLFASTCTVEHVQHALEMLCSEGGWDVLYASQLLPHSLLFQALQRNIALDTNTGFQTNGDVQREHGDAPGLQSFDGESCSRMPALSLAELPQKIRRNAMYYRNRALRLGRLELTVADETNWAPAFEALQSLHTARWQSRGETGVLSDERVLAWHREALPLLARSGLLRLCCLRLNGEIIGVLYSLVDLPSRPVRTQYFYLTAYAIHHEDLRPGTLLLALAIDRAASEGVAIIDMLRGDEAYKQIWHMERTPTFGFRMRRPAHDRTAAQGTEAAA